MDKIKEIIDLLSELRLSKKWSWSISDDDILKIYKNNLIYAITIDPKHKELSKDFIHYDLSRYNPRLRTITMLISLFLEDNMEKKQ